MKLLFVGTNRGGGGTESHFVTLARTMQELGHQVEAVVYTGSPIHIGLQGSGVVLHEGVFRNAFDPRGFRTVWRVVKQFRPDWIIGSFSKEYWPLAILSKMLGVKLALFKHMDFPMRPLTNYFIPRLADRFIVISEFMKKKFIERGVRPEHMQVLYNPLNLEYYKPDSELRQKTRQSFEYADDDVVLGFLGALHPDKGMLQLADALNQAMIQLPKLKALWVGEGRAAEALDEKINAGGFASRHKRHNWTPDVRPFYAAMDMLAMPSVQSDTFGRVSIEAQACGVPVLCSDIGGIPETLISAKTGLLLPPGDIPAWRDAIIKLATDITIRSSMAEQGRSWVDRSFGARVIGKEFEKLLKSDSIVSLVKSLTIYILCHNRPDDTRQAIQSVINQTDQAFTLIVSDNSSNDEVEHMVKNEFPEIQYIRRQPMLPSAYHFKRVIDEAQGDYFCLFHDDDLMHPNFVCTMKQAIQDFPSAVAIACNANIELFGNLKPRPSFRTFRSYDVIHSPRELAKRYFSRSQSGIAPFPSYIYNRHKVSSRMLAVEGGKYSDVTWLLNIAKTGKIVWIGQPLMTYRMHASNDGNIESLRDRLRFLSYLKQNKAQIGMGVLQDYRCSFIYKKINKLDDKIHVKRRKTTRAFLNTYRWLRYARLDTYGSLFNRALIKLMTK